MQPASGGSKSRTSASASFPYNSLPLLNLLTLYHLYVAGQKPLISLRSLTNKRHFLEKNKTSQLWASFFWFLLAPFCFLHACVLPSGRLGVDREICERRWRFANHPTGCLIKCESKHGEKRSSLSFSLQIKCYVPLAGIRSTMLGLHLLFLTAPQRAVLLLFCKPASCSWRVQKETCCRKKKKGFSDKREEIQNQLKNQNLKSMIIVDGRKTHNLKSASLGTWLRTIALEGSHLDFPAGLNGKESPILQETWVQSLGQEDCLKEGMATHSGILAWRIPWTGESGELQSIVVQRVGHTKWLTLLPFHITLETVPQCWGSSLKT